MKHLYDLAQGSDKKKPRPTDVDRGLNSPTSQERLTPSLRLWPGDPSDLW